MPIIRKTDQENLRAEILAGRDAGDQRWQQKWDDLDAFPYDDTDQHQAEYLAGRPVLLGLLNQVAAAQVAKASPPPAQGKAPVPNVRSVMRGVAVPPNGKVNDGPSPRPPMGPTMGQGMEKRQGYVPPPSTEAMSINKGRKYAPPPPPPAMDVRPAMQQAGLEQWMPPQLAQMFDENGMPVRRAPRRPME